MLLGIQIKNFLSFNQIEDENPISFSLIPGKVQNQKDHVYISGKFKVLKFTSVFGANAAGKSNLVKALRFIQLAVKGRWPKRYIDSYFKPEPENAKQPSFFEISILLKGTVYRYGFKMVLNKGQFVEEWLNECTSRKSNKIVFERNTLDGFYKFDERLMKKGLEEKLNVYAGDVSTDGSVLLLTILNKNKDKLYEDFPVAHILRDVYNWITKELYIVLDETPISNYTYLIRQQSIGSAFEILRHFRTGIRDFELVDVPLDKVLAELPIGLKNMLLETIAKNIEKLAKGKRTLEGISLRYNKNLFIISYKDFIDNTEQRMCKTLKFKHEKDNILFDFWEESDGTIRLLDLLEILIAGKQQTFLIDEFELRLHPNLTKEFVRLFLEFAKERNVQLIITTHETELLDLDLVRRDEIQLLERQADGSTHIIPLESKNVRFDKVINKAYLRGLYGGTNLYE